MQIADGVRIITVIELKFHLAHEQRKVALECTVIDLQPSFGKAPVVLDPVDMGFASIKRRFMGDAHMGKTFHIESVIGPEAVRVHPGLRPHVGLDRALKRKLVQPFGKHDPDFTGAPQQSKYRDFAACTTPSLAFTDTAEVRLIDFDFAAELSQRALAFRRNGFPEPRAVLRLSPMSRATRSAGAISQNRRMISSAVFAWSRALRARGVNR